MLAQAQAYVCWFYFMRFLHSHLTCPHLLFFQWFSTRNNAEKVTAKKCGLMNKNSIQFNSHWNVCERAVEHSMDCCKCIGCWTLEVLYGAEQSQTKQKEPIQNKSGDNPLPIRMYVSRSVKIRATSATQKKIGAPVSSTHSQCWQCSESRASEHADR